MGLLARHDSRRIRTVDESDILALVRAVSRMPLACLSSALGPVLDGASLKLSTLDVDVD